MQALILAAGKSTRTYPLTLTRPKPLLKAANKTFLEWNLDALQGIVSEAVIVVGYKQEMVRKDFGKKYKKIKIKYAVQKQQLGTGHAVMVAESLIKDKFILMMGDDIYSRGDIKNCIKHRYSILVTKVKNPQNFGVILHKNNILVDFVEKPKKFVSDLASTAFYCLDRKIFYYLKQIKKSERNELEFPDAVKMLAKNEKVYCVKSKGWKPIAYPWDLLDADISLRKNKNSIGKNSKIFGKVINSSIGNNCIINGTIKNSIIMDNTIISENSMVENSIIGENVHFDGKIKAKEHGAIISDGVDAHNATIAPGCRIWPNKKIKNKTIKKDLV